MAVTSCCANCDEGRKAKGSDRLVACRALTLEGADPRSLLDHFDEVSVGWAYLGVRHGRPTGDGRLTNECILLEPNKYCEKWRKRLDG